MEEIKPKSAITLPYYWVQSELLGAFHEMLNDPECKPLVIRFDAEIKVAFGNVLSWFYFVQNIAYNELPCPVLLERVSPPKLDIDEGIERPVMISYAALCGVKHPNGSGVPKTFRKFVRQVERVKEVAKRGLAGIRSLSQPTGTECDVRQNLIALRDRLKLSIQMLKTHIETLPSYLSFISFSKLLQCPQLKKGWATHNGEIVQAFERAYIKLERLTLEKQINNTSLYKFTLEVSRDTWPAVIDNSRALSDMLEKAASEQLRRVHNQLAHSTLYDLAHELAYLVALNVTADRTLYEVQQLCQPLQAELKRLHQLDWSVAKNKGGPLQKVMQIVDNGYLQLECHLTELDGDRAHPLVLSAPMRLICLLDEAVGDRLWKTSQIQGALFLQTELKHLNGVIKRALLAFGEPPIGGTVLRPPPLWRQVGKLVSEQRDEVVRLLSSGITPYFYELQSRFMAAYQELRESDRCRDLIKAEHQPIRGAFSLFLTNLYAVRQFPYFELPGSKQLDPHTHPKVEPAVHPGTGVDAELERLREVKERIKGPVPTAYARFLACAEEIADIVLGETEELQRLVKPRGVAVDVRQHLEALAGRLKVAQAMFEKHIKELPCFVTHFLWLPSNETKKFKAFWKAKTGEICQALSEAQNHLTKTLADDTHLCERLLGFFECTLDEYLPTIERTSLEISKRMSEALRQCVIQNNKQLQSPMDLMVINTLMTQTIIHDVQHHLAHLCPLAMTQGWHPSKVSELVEPLIGGLRGFVTIKWTVTGKRSPLRKQVLRATRIVRSGLDRMEKLLAKLDGDEAPELILSGPLHLVIAINSALEGVANRAMKSYTNDSEPLLFAQLQLYLIPLREMLTKVIGNFRKVPALESKIE